MERLAKTALFDHVRRVGSAHWHTQSLSSHFSATLLSIAMGYRVSCQRRRCAAKVNATVVVNIFTLEVAVEDVNTDGEKKGLTTAHETLLDHARWARPYFYGGAVQQGKFRPVSGFLNGSREGYKAVTAPGYDGQLTAFGPFVADTTSEGFDAFRKFTKQNENREKAQIQVEAVRVALSLATNDENEFKKESFSIHPKLHARKLEYLNSYKGDIKDPKSATTDALEGLGDQRQALRRASSRSCVDVERLGSRLHEARGLQNAEGASRKGTEDTRKSVLADLPGKFWL